MAEEKIRILVATDPCETCKLKPCPRKCMFSILYEKAKGITRQEAIEKMAKAACRANQKTKSCDECIYGTGSFAQEKDFFCNKELNHVGFDGGVSYLKQAEAALNALLQEK